MLNFFRQIYNKIRKFNEYTNQYLKITGNIELPSLAYTNWGLYFANLKDFDTAIEKLETAIIMSNQNPKPCISLGVIYAKLKNYEKAEIALKEAIKRDSQNSYAYTVLSSIYVAVNKFDLAEDAIKKALKLSPSDSEVYLNYGILYAKQKRKQKAIEMLKKAKFLNPTNAHTCFILGVILFETDNIEDAFVEFKQLENLEPDYKNLNYYMALCYKKEKNYMAVIEYAQRALSQDFQNPSLYILLAQVYLILNQYNKVNEIYELSEKNKLDDFEILLSWGISLIKMNKINEAKEKLYKALEKEQNNSIALYRLGSCFYKENNTEEAEKYFNKAIDSDYKNSSAIADLGMIYYEKKEYETAIQTFFNAISISAENAYLYFYIANCYFRLGKLKKSNDYYEKTIEYYPQHIEAYINYCICLLYLHNDKEALRKIRRAYQINRNSEKIILMYAVIDLKTGINIDAIEKADILLKKNQNNKDAKLIKAHALININKPQDAINILCSLDEKEKNSDIYNHLSFLAYKILVEENPSHYNESMLNLFLGKINESSMDINQYGINAYISDLNINKGIEKWD